MPEIDSLAEISSAIDVSGSEAVGETLIFSPDVIKTEEGNHVILVVPESSEHLVSDEHLVDGETSYVIPADSSRDDALNTTRLRETIKSNFLVIAKLLPSKSPPPLVPISGHINESFPNGSLEVGSVIERLQDTGKVKSRPPRAPRQSTGKGHQTTKQEGPEIFGKMFPASYNEVLFKQIREIIFYKYGKGFTDETEVTSGIKCPHCRKKPSSLTQLKDHLNNCHTYAPPKRKSSDRASRSVKIKKMFFRCQYCDEAFISQSHREGHECRLTVKSIEIACEADVSTTCSICSQDFGSTSELLSHQEIDHRDVKVVSKPPAKYVACPICSKRVLVTARDEHVRKHELHSLIEEIPSSPGSECTKCSQPVVDGVCSCPSNANDSAICPLCDKEVPTSKLKEHIDSHASSAQQATSPN